MLNKIFTLCFVLLVSCHVYGGETHHRTLNDLDSCDSRQILTVLDSASYVWHGTKVEEVQNAKAMDGYHTYIIQPVIHALFQQIGILGKRNPIAYSCTHLLLQATANDKSIDHQPCTFIIDILTFASDQTAITEKLKSVSSDAPLAVNVVSEAPTACFCIPYKGKVITVFYNLFDEPEVIHGYVMFYLSQMTSFQCFNRLFSIR